MIQKEYITTAELLATLKERLKEKLEERPYEVVDDYGNSNIVDPLDAKSLAAIGSFLLRLSRYEDEQNNTNAIDVEAMPLIPGS